MGTRTKYFLTLKLQFGNDIENLYIYYTKKISILFFWIALAFCRF